MLPLSSVDLFHIKSRAFMESHLPAFKENNPQLEVVTELIRGQHPLLKGFYSKTLSQTPLTVSFLSSYIDTESFY